MSTELTVSGAKFWDWEPITARWVFRGMCGASEIDEMIPHLAETHRIVMLCDLDEANKVIAELRANEERNLANADRQRATINRLKAGGFVHLPMKLSELMQVGTSTTSYVIAQVAELERRLAIAEAAKGA